MAVSAEQLVTPENREVNENGDVIRSKIGRLLENPYFQRTLDKEALKNYRDLAEKKGHIDPNDTENLSKFYEFMADHFKEAEVSKKRITGHVEQAIQDKVITEKDRVFYKKNMKANVVSGEQIVTKEALEQAEKDILESLENRRKERKEYDNLVSSPLIESGFLLIDKNKKIPFPDETGYLNMSVPERRKWLKEIRKTIPQAKEYADNREKKETEELEKEYDILLQAAKKEGVIGNKTLEKFKEWFKGQEVKAKTYAISQFTKEMNRYRVLWKDIRKNLKGSALSRLEALRDKMGYTELRSEFMKEQYGEKSDPSLKILSTITNTTVRKEILHAKKSLNRGEKKTFVERLTHYFSSKQSDRQDAVSYQDNVRAARKKHDTAYGQKIAENAEASDENRGLEGSRQNLQIHDVDENAVERAQPDTLRKSHPSQPTKSPEIRIKKSTDRAYQRNTFVDEKGQKRRVIRVGGTKEGVQAFNNEGLLNRDKDELSIMAKDGSNIVEMKMREIRVMKDVLKKSLEEDSVETNK